MLDESGKLVTEVEAFLTHLFVRGRTTYALHSYALGLADFVSWVAARREEIEGVDLRLVEAYATAFRFGAKAGANVVPPRTRGPAPSGGL